MSVTSWVWFKNSFLQSDNQTLLDLSPHKHWTFQVPRFIGNQHQRHHSHCQTTLPAAFSGRPKAASQLWFTTQLHELLCQTARRGQTSHHRSKRLTTSWQHTPSGSQLLVPCWWTLSSHQCLQAVGCCPWGHQLMAFEGFGVKNRAGSSGFSFWVCMSLLVVIGLRRESASTASSRQDPCTLLQNRASDKKGHQATKRPPLLFIRTWLKQANGLYPTQPSLC